MPLSLCLPAPGQKATVFGQPLEECVSHMLPPGGSAAQTLGGRFSPRGSLEGGRGPTTRQVGAELLAKSQRRNQDHSGKNQAALLLQGGDRRKSQVSWVGIPALLRPDHCTSLGLSHLI